MAVAQSRRGLERFDEREEINNVLGEKAVIRIGRGVGVRSIFIALHKTKVTDVVYEDNFIRSRGPNDQSILFGRLTLCLDPYRQNMDSVVLGVVDVRCEPTEDDLDCLAQWAVLDRLAMLTVFFGSARWLVEDIAWRANAISWTPLYQAIKGPGGESLVHPSYYVFFGFYRKITVVEDAAAVADTTLVLGDDIWREMVRAEDVPTWTPNDIGSAFVQSLGHIKMKPLDPARWFNGCFQTVAWLGTAVSSYAVQEKENERRSREKGKGKPKGKGKGKGKRKIIH
jgi:hypothetical protein